jgi:hypothetical protein
MLAPTSRIRPERSSSPEKSRSRTGGFGPSQALKTYSKGRPFIMCGYNGQTWLAGKLVD